MFQSLKVNIEPKNDGDITKYYNTLSKRSRYFNSNKSVIFINGMKVSPQAHMENALALSELQMCNVIGVYNASEWNEKDSLVNRMKGIGLDLWQCLLDKTTFHGPDASPLAKPFVQLFRDFFLQGKVNENTVRTLFIYNKVNEHLFDLLRSQEHRYTTIFAHSQGNLILSNVLTGILLADGRPALLGREINSFGSPVVNWPPPIKPNEFAFTCDPVALLSGIDFTFTITKVGSNIRDGTLFNHGFLQYVKNDPAFVVNRHAKKWGITWSLDNEGLADEIIKMENNLWRIENIFKYLYDNHFDKDDVVLAYVKKLMRLPQKHIIIDAIKRSSFLRYILINSMEKGWTSKDEQGAINYLKSIGG